MCAAKRYGKAEEHALRAYRIIDIDIIFTRKMLAENLYLHTLGQKMTGILLLVPFSILILFQISGNLLDFSADMRLQAIHCWPPLISLVFISATETESMRTTWSNIVSFKSLNCD